MMSTEDIRTIVQEVLSRLKTHRSHPEEADTLLFQRVLNKASRRMNSALTQLKVVAEIYQTDPDAKKKDQLREYIQNAMNEIKQVEEILHYSDCLYIRTVKVQTNKLEVWREAELSRC